VDEEINDEENIAIGTQSSSVRRINLSPFTPYFEKEDHGSDPCGINRGIAE